MQGDNPTSRAYNRLMQERADRTPWSYDQQEAADSEDGQDTASEPIEPAIE